MHIIAILLFPLRLVTAPFAGTVLAGMMTAINRFDDPIQHSFFYYLPTVTKAWLLWYA